MLDFCLLEVFESVSILVLVIGLFLFSISSWFSLEKWYLSKNLSISSRLSHFIGVWLLVKVAQLYPILGDSVDCNLPGSSVHGIFQAGVLEWLAVSVSTGSSQPRDRTPFSGIAYSLQSELPGKPKDTGVGSLSLLQCILLTQELNLGGFAGGFFTS